MTDFTLKITDKQIGFIRLIARSKDVGDGWRAVSGVLRNFAEATAAERPELYETRVTGEKLMIRLSERGAILEAEL